MGIIAYTQRVHIVESYNERRDCIDQRIPLFLKECGFTSIALPNVKDIVRSILNEVKVDGIVLTGGNSLVKYGGDAPERDCVDNFLIEYCLDNGIPIYGICRGMQSLLDFFSVELVEVNNHVAVKHRIYDVDNKLIRITNSFHNQGAFFIKEPLKIIAKSDDGIIEAIENKEQKILGTMWHPEREKPYLLEDINMVKNFFGI